MFLLPIFLLSILHIILFHDFFFSFFTNRWDQQQRDLIGSHEQYTAEITEEYEQKLEEDRQARLHQADERDELSARLSTAEQSVEVPGPSWPRRNLPRRGLEVLRPIQATC